MGRSSRERKKWAQMDIEKEENQQIEVLLTSSSTKNHCTQELQGQVGGLSVRRELGQVSVKKSYHHPCYYGGLPIIRALARAAKKRVKNNTSHIRKRRGGRGGSGSLGIRRTGLRQSPCILQGRVEGRKPGVLRPSSG